MRLNYLNASWSKVLKAVAENNGLTLVMEQSPKGRFTRHDWRRYSLVEAMRVLDKELRPLGYRLMRKSNYLVVLETKADRHRYERPIVPNSVEPVQRPHDRSNQQVQNRYNETQAERRVGRRNYAVQQAGHVSTPGTRPRIQQVHHNEHLGPLPVDADTLISVPIRYKNARLLSRKIYNAFKDRAELVDDGPAGLPAIRVLASNDSTAIDKKSGPDLFQLGVDVKGNQVVIQAPSRQGKALERLIRWMDELPASSNGDIHLVATSKGAAKIAKRLRPALGLMVAQRGTNATGQNPANSQTQTPPAPPQPKNGEQPAEPPTAGSIRGLKGDVTVESLDDLGILIIRGNEADVAAVMAVIRQIEELAIGTTPEIHLRILQDVDSEALAELLTTVYESLAGARGRVIQQTNTISFVPVVKPNAVLILSSKNDRQSVLDLIDQLDQPIDPRTEFAIFELKFAVASQVVTAIDAMYNDPDPTGLGTRVKAIADARTNTVVVQARPRDLEEVALFVNKIDSDTSNSVVKLRVFKLNNSVAEELAEIITSAIQSVLFPQQQGQGQFGGFAQGAGGQNRQLTETKSSVIEFTSGDDGQRVIRSGLLTDVRVSADPRTNSLTVIAPEQSMEMMAALIEQYDQPATQIAEIKVFTLANADASLVAQLLQDLLAEQQTTNQQSPLGIQLAGATDASSNLIPLTFTVDVRSNSILVKGGIAAIDVVAAIIYTLDDAEMRQRETLVIKLKNSFAPFVADSINNFRDTLRGLQQSDADLVSPYELLEQEIVVVADETTNNLLISVSPRYADQVRDLVEELDRAPQQVMIQALLVEVVLENDDELGVELGFQDSVLFNRSFLENIETIQTTTQTAGNDQIITQSIISQEANPGFLFNNPTLGNNVNAAANKGQVGPQGLSNFATGRFNSELGFGGLILSAGSDSVSVLLRALSQQRNVEILSRPQIRTLDNQFSSIHVGQIVPRITQVDVDQDTGSTSPVLVDEPVGILLEVTPRISPDGTVVMEVLATKSALSGQGVPLFTTTTVTAALQTIESPIIDTSTAQTTVAVQSGQTVVIGGMITNEIESVERKVPWLGDVPILGQAFRFDSSSTRRTELLIFLTPRIIHSDEESEEIKQIETGRMHFVVESADEIHGPIYGIESEITEGMETPTDANSSNDQSMNIPVPPAFGDEPPTTFVPGPAAPLERNAGQPERMEIFFPADVNSQNSATDQPSQQGQIVRAKATQSSRKKTRFASFLNPFD